MHNQGCVDERNRLDRWVRGNVDEKKKHNDVKRREKYYIKSSFLLYNAILPGQLPHSLVFTHARLRVRTKEVCNLCPDGAIWRSAFFFRTTHTAAHNKQMRNSIATSPTLTLVWQLEHRLQPVQTAWHSHHLDGRPHLHQPSTRVGEGEASKRECNG